MHNADFIFGVATASFQIEGAADQRLPCIWDTFCSTPGKIADGSDGLTACEHVKFWRDDVELIASLGVDAYRLSISWPRVITQNGELNAEGVKFYCDLLDALNAKGIKPFVTLYHWDLPAHIEANGGWLNRQTAFLYADYVEKIVTAFGARVYSYATFNEPFCSAFLGYEAGVHAPGLTGQKNGRQAAHHILLAHGLGLQVLRRLSPHTINGIVLNFTPCYANSSAEADLRATQAADEYHNLWYLMPIMTGRYPYVMAQIPEQNRPHIEAGDMQLISAPLDFLGINFYTRRFYSAPNEPDALFQELPHRAPLTDIGWEIYPQSFTKLLTDLHQRFQLPPIYITENGAAMADEYVAGQVHDVGRLAYYQSHIGAVNDAMEQGVDVRGYFAWSLMDNFEWAEGYLKRFGIVYVDYLTQQRTIKLSGLAYRDMLAARRNSNLCQK
ncbi:GH1 family beta-glucosidase [Pseudoalteromonas fenneropenaei]|uniref:Beta-glucosidase n=1 Tax=Pseudoalteromonas fenneropenaei TaxID=1737459 RepID=A0ABV7CNW9_9GAMM